ncbi:sigma-54-dependent Fis family transcriptional regulator [Marinomonas rhizomae]|uniref:Transcriptional regulator of acetoin/glycerol metabolism n=1 Tax=Marinomonas rhizomae TaxID=491948 RepID=A0A366J9X6_9GAMM|nr:sigma-54-dependent Fis family transcriptional regulator [Marinomonas rhizomae]RBP83752.1 transcriptional regulator of acetoin/glycerol metabolism [Marinomonas rhizomae]RNF73531.1 sigma-54-dependent Fis family transcriptional regulator [Marinomonas rhizomae]
MQEEEQKQRAFHALVDEDSTQDSSLSQTHKERIQASWYRCEQFGLDHSSRPDFATLPRGTLSDLVDQHRSLLETTENEVLPYYENILSNSACMIVLADRQGHVLNTWGQPRFGSAEEHGLVGGNQWTEMGVGTNAIGTALITGEAIQVGRDEHFLRANRFMVGSASPIYNTKNDLVGVLDISSDAYLPQDHTFGMVKLMSLSVENRLIFSAFQQEHFILSFNTNVVSLDSHWSGILVLDENGTIVSANRRAEVVLARDLALLNINQVFDIEMREIKHHPFSLPMKLIAMGRYQFYVKVIPPVQQIMRVPDFRQRADYVAPSQTETLVMKEKNPPTEKIIKAEKASIKTIPDNVIPLSELQHGDERVERLVRQAHKIMEKDIPILIHGETGAGKEIFVRSLHYHSSRAKEMLVAVNCAAIPAELVESELFGYEKGAFTGAQNRGSIGLIRRAHHGTLFLDEIGEMPMAVQSRLLRVLQERVVTPLGSTEAFPVDIKLISATNRILKDEVKEGRFRQDLYYRISGLNIELPALRERLDKGELIQYLHNRLRKEEPGPPLSDSMVALLVTHPWPGNMRQLAHVLKVGMAMADEEVLEEWHLPDDFFDDLEAVTPSDYSTQSSATGEEEEPLEKLIPRLLSEFKGNVSQTAKSAGVSRNTVYKYAK